MATSSLTTSAQRIISIHIPDYVEFLCWKDLQISFASMKTRKFSCEDLQAVVDDGRLPALNDWSEARCAAK